MPVFSILLAAAALQMPAQPRLDLPGRQASERIIVLDAQVACRPDRAYGLWATQDGVRFFAPAARVDGHVGGRYTIIFFPRDDPEGRRYGTAGAHLLAAEPGRFLAFEWVVFAGDDAKGDRAPPYAPLALRLPQPLPTWVEIAFTPSGDGTRVAFRHFGFGEGLLWERSRAWFVRAWGGVLRAMEAACRN